MKLGAVATGGSFFNRESELNALFEHLEDDHIVMSGPRRLGKSSILQKLVELAPEHKFTATVMDLQGEDPSPEGFVQKLEKTFPKQSKQQTLREKLSRLNPLKNVKSGGVKAAGVGANVEFTEVEKKPWQEHADFCLEKLSKQKTIILIDEFSVFLEKFITRHPQQVGDFLDWLRSWRIRSNTQFRFLFTGSIGLQSLLEMNDLVLPMNDCFDFQLGPFKRPHAIAMLQQFSDKKGWQLSTSDAEFICVKTGWLSPFFLNLLLNEAIRFADDRFAEAEQEGDASAESPKDLNAQDIEFGYEKLLSVRSRFSHWVSRLKDQFDDPKETQAAHLILSALSQSASGLTTPQLDIRLSGHLPAIETRQKVRQKVLLLLQEHGYVTVPDSQSKVDFLSFLIKEYWRRNHCEAY